MCRAHPSTVSSEARTMASSAGSSRPPPTASSPIVMFGPSGTGKSTLLKRLQQEPEWQKFGFSVSRTSSCVLELLSSEQSSPTVATCRHDPEAEGGRGERRGLPFHDPR